MNSVAFRQSLFAFALAFVFLCTASAHAADCVPIAYLKATMDKYTLYFKNDQTYNQSVFQFKGGKSPWNVKVVAGSLPPGMSLKVVPFTGGYALDGYSGDVYLVGQPTAEGDFKPQIQFTDSCPNGAQSKTSSLLLQVRCGKVKFMPEGLQLPPAVLGRPYQFQFKASCDPKYEQLGFSSNPSTFPPGLSISDSGLLSGTPTKLKPYKLTVIANVYGAGFQSAVNFFPLEVIDNVPPTLTYFDVTKRALTSLGGKADVILRVTDNGLLRFPQVTVTSPEGAKTNYYAGLKQGTKDEYQVTITLPGNNKNTDAVYKVSGVVQDESGNTVTCPIRTITVSRVQTSIPTGVQSPQGPIIPTQPNFPRPVQRIPAR